jgi:hypothetical protein
MIKRWKFLVLVVAVFVFGVVLLMGSVEGQSMCGPDGSVGYEGICCHDFNCAPEFVCNGGLNTCSSSDDCSEGCVMNQCDGDPYPVGTCQCPEGYVWDTDSGMCILFVPPETCCQGPGCPPDECYPPLCGDFGIQDYDGDGQFDEFCDGGGTCCDSYYDCDPNGVDCSTEFPENCPAGQICIAFSENTAYIDGTGPGPCSYCEKSECGNGIWEPWFGEECDDGGKCGGVPGGTDCFIQTASLDCGAGIECVPLDNDGDYCSSTCQDEAITECNDGIDNDGDGDIDWNEDLDCGGDPSTLSENWKCDDDQTIMRLSDVRNAHVSFWDQPDDLDNLGNPLVPDDYSIEICYDVIFGNSFEYPDGFDVHECSGDPSDPDNFVVSIADPYNAHIEVGSINYLNNVCYGILECIAKVGSGALPCAGNEREVLTLGKSGVLTSRNLHVGIPGLNGQDGGYYGDDFGGRICCKDKPTVYKVQWENGLELPIHSASVGQTVYLAIYSNIEGNQPTANVLECDDGCGIIDDIISDPSSGNIYTDEDGVARIPWEITTQHLIQGGIQEESDEDFDDNIELFFTMSIAGGQNTILVDSRDFSIEGTPYNGFLVVDALPDPPDIDFSLVHRGIYFTDVPLTIEETSGDDPTIHTYEWSIQKTENGEIVEEFSGGGESFDYTFFDPGMRTVSLKKTNTENGLYSELEKSILVVASDFAFTYINKPFHHQVVPIDEDKILPILMFSARDSYVLRVGISVGGGNTCPVSIECLNGWCPVDTENVPIGCNQGDGADGRLDVLGGVTDPPDVATAYNNMFFEWSFGPGDYVTNYVEGFGLVEETTAVNFASTDKNDKDIDLSITYYENGNPTSTFEINDRQYTLGQCLVTPDKAIWVEIDEFGNLVREWNMYNFNENNRCVGVDLIPGTEDDCCPNGFTCRDDIDQGIHCYGSPINFCEDYSEYINSETYDPDGDGTPYGPNDCNDDTEGVLGSQFYFDNIIQQCGSGLGKVNCVWSQIDDETGSCDAVTTCFDCEDVLPGEVCEICESYSCAYDITSTDCTGGTKEITYTFDPLNSRTGDCPDGPNEEELPDLCDRPPQIVSCGKIGFELGFFDYRNVFATIMLLTGIYLLMGALRRKGKLK